MSSDVLSLWIFIDFASPDDTYRAVFHLEKQYLLHDPKQINCYMLTSTISLLRPDVSTVTMRMRFTLRGIGTR